MTSKRLYRNQELVRISGWDVISQYKRTKIGETMRANREILKFMKCCVALQFPYKLMT